MIEGLVEVVSMLGGASGIGVAVWYLINMHSKRKVEQAEAMKAEAEADQAVQSNEQNSVNWVLKQITNLQSMQQAQNEKILKIERGYTIMIAVVKDLDLHYCSKLQCAIKEPPLGTYHTALKSLDDLVTQPDIIQKNG